MTCYVKKKKKKKKKRGGGGLFFLFACVFQKFLTKRYKDVAMGPDSGPANDGDDARVPRTATSTPFWRDDETISRGADQQHPMDSRSSSSKSDSMVSRSG